jgi:hypothetical protein
MAFNTKTEVLVQNLAKNTATADPRCGLGIAATLDCLRLNQTQFRGGPHCCAITAEPLPDGEFDITCV